MIVSAAVSVATVALFLIARAAATRSNGHPLANPILATALTIGTLLWATGIAPGAYTAAAAPLGWLLGPAVVALASVVYRARRMLVEQAVPTLAAVAVGSLTGIASAVGLARLFGLDPALIQALAAKSVTSPFAIALMQELGGPPDLAAGLVIVTGIGGAILLPPLLTRLGLPLGTAMGQAAHIVGTDAMARRDADGAAEAALAMALAGIVTSLLLPPLWRFV